MGTIGQSKRVGRGSREYTEEGVSEYVPIARLLAIAYRSLVEALHEELAKRGVRDMRPAYAFVMLAVRRGPIAINDVGDLLGITKQAASKLVDGIERDGYVRRVVQASDARSRKLELTKRGHHVLEIVESIYRKLEDEWAEIVTPRHVETLRSDLIKILRAQNDGELPPIRPTW